MLGHEDRETDDQKWITPIEPSVDPHAVNAVLGASIGLFSSFVYGGSGSGSAAVGALSGVMSTYSGVCREHLDAWISMIEPKDAPDLRAAVSWRSTKRPTAR